MRPLSVHHFPITPQVSLLQLKGHNHLLFFSISLEERRSGTYLVVNQYLSLSNTEHKAKLTNILKVNCSNFPFHKFEHIANNVQQTIQISCIWHDNAIFRRANSFIIFNIHKANLYSSIHTQKRLVKVLYNYGNC